MSNCFSSVTADDLKFIAFRSACLGSPEISPPESDMKCKCGFFRLNQIKPKNFAWFHFQVVERTFFISMAAGDFVTSQKFMHVSCWAGESHGRKKEIGNSILVCVFVTRNFSCYSNSRQRLKLIRLRGVSERIESRVSWCMEKCARKCLHHDTTLWKAISTRNECTSWDDAFSFIFHQCTRKSNITNNKFYA